MILEVEITDAPCCGKTRAVRHSFDEKGRKADAVNR
jgi:hypothetical protein